MKLRLQAVIHRVEPGRDQVDVGERRQRPIVWLRRGGVGLVDIASADQLRAAGATVADAEHGVLEGFGLDREVPLLGVASAQVLVVGRHARR